MRPLGDLTANAMALEKGGTEILAAGRQNSSLFARFELRLTRSPVAPEELDAKPPDHR
jgi:hypothetical protein